MFFNHTPMLRFFLDALYDQASAVHDMESEKRLEVDPASGIVDRKY
jgi:hypothetical protein